MIKIDYDKILKDYNISLIQKLRGFGSNKSYLQFWVPDNDIVESILSLINSCKESKEYFVEIKLKKKNFLKKIFNKLKKTLETVGDFHSSIKEENIYIRINIDQYKTHEYSNYKKFKTLKVQGKKIKNEKNSKLHKEVFIKKKYVKIINSIELSEISSPFFNHKLSNNINIKVEKTLLHNSYFADFNLNINLKAIEEQEVQSRVDKAATLINDSSKTIYTFLGPIATAVTAFYFSGLGTLSKT
jgi:hypothetical protein